MKVLITGITGFVGSHLAEYLLEQEVEVYGISRWRSKMENIEHLGSRLQLLNADIRDPFSMKEAVAKTNPDYIFHLASQSYVPESWRAPHETLYTNIIGTLNVLEAVKQVGCDSVIQVAGSSEEYGLVLEGELPVKESNPLRPISPYGVSKVTADLLARQYFVSYGLKTIVSRCFNTEGPRRGEVFTPSRHAKRMAEILKGKSKPVWELGNMDAERDFTDVRDVVKALWLLVNKCKYGEVYNICSGKSYKMMFIVDYLVHTTGIKVKYVTNLTLMRPSDVPRLLGDYSKFRSVTGWTPTIPFEKTLDDLLKYWLEKV